MTINRQTIVTVSDEIAAAIADVLDKHGLELVGRRGTYGDVCTVKLEMAAKAPDGAAFNPNTKEATALTRFAASYGLPADALGRTFASGGKVHTVIGLNTRAQKRPVLTRGDDGKQYAWPETAIATHLEAVAR